MDLLRRAKIVHLCLGVLMKLAPCSLSAQQWVWTYIFNDPDSTAIINDALELGADKLYVIGSDDLYLTQGRGTIMHHFQNLTLQNTVITEETDVNYALNVLLPSSAGDFCAIGSKAQEFGLDSAIFHTTIWRIGAALQVLEQSVMGPESAGNTTFAACQSVDGTYVGISNQYSDPPVPVDFQTFHFGIELDSVNSCNVYSAFNPFYAHSIRPWTNGGYLCASYGLWSGGSQPGTFTILEQDLCTVRVNFDATPTAPSDLPLYELSAIGMYPEAMAHGVAHIIACGEAYDVTEAGADFRCAIQVLDTLGAIVRQRMFRSSFWADMPAVYNSMDTTSGERYFYAQMEGRDLSNEAFRRPCDVRVLLLDTMLEVLGEYTIDGHADSLLYELRRVRSARDGGVYLMGRVMNLDAPQPRWQGWITKVELSAFTTGLSEQRRRYLTIYPNPGEDSFRIGFDTNESWVLLIVIDELGRTVHKQTLVGAECIVDATSWASGAYHLRVLHRDGGLLSTGVWMKR